MNVQCSAQLLSNSNRVFVLRVFIDITNCVLSCECDLKLLPFKSIQHVFLSWAPVNLDFILNRVMHFNDVFLTNTAAWSF